MRIVALAFADVALFAELRPRAERADRATVSWL